MCAAILIVDDHLPSRKVLVTVLGNEKHRMLEANDGAEALAIVRAELPDLVISDILMPTMDGYEFVRQLRTDPAIAHVPVIFYTAQYDKQEARELARSCGVAHIVMKPCKFELMAQTVAEALATPLQITEPWLSREFDREHVRVVTDKLSQTANQLRISNLHLAELVAKLQEREAGLSRAQHMAMLAHVITGRDGSFESWSDTLPVLIGMDSAHMPRSAREGLEILHADDRAMVREKCIEADATGTRVDIEYRLRRVSDSTWVRIRQVIEPLEGDAGVNGERRWFSTLQDVTEQKLAEDALSQCSAELRDLAAAANSAREKEKSRVARELHDELAQSLTSLKMDVAEAQQQLPTGQRQLSTKLQSMQTTIDDIVAATRRIAADLRPLMLDDLGLVPAAEWLVQNFTQRTGVQCRLSVEPPELELQDPQATAVFRILQESLANIAHHAHASSVEVALKKSVDGMVLKVRDDGSGYDPGNPRKPDSFGLVGLRERVSLLGGEIHINAAPGHGVAIEVRIPLQEPEQP